MMREFVSSVAIACVHLGLGNKDQALGWLEQACQERNQRLIGLKTHWRYDPLRAEPRFQELLRRMNFP